MAILLYVFLIFLPVRSEPCDWEIVVVTPPVFWAWNHRTEERSFFSMESFGNNQRECIYQGAMFNAYPLDDKFLIHFCKEEVA